MLILPPSVACGLCSGLCKRAVKIPCCDAIACRPCAVKAVTQNHKCWNDKCAKDLTSSDIINNDSLRAEIDSLSDGSFLDCGLCKEMCKRGAKIDCCGARACRACAIKEITKTRSCWSCSKPGLTSENLINDDLLRSAVEHFKNHKILLPEHKNGLAKREKKLELFNADSEATTSHVKNTPSSAQKIEKKFDPKARPSTAPTKQIELLLKKKLEHQKQARPSLFGNQTENRQKTSFPSKNENEDTNYFERSVPELKLGPTVPAASRGQGRPIVDNGLLEKRMALYQLKQKLRGAAFGQRGRGQRGRGFGKGSGHRGQEFGTGANTSPLGQRGQGGLGSGALSAALGQKVKSGKVGGGNEVNANIAPLGQRGSGGFGGSGDKEAEESTSTVTTLLGEYGKLSDGGGGANRGSLSKKGGFGGTANTRGASRGRGGLGDKAAKRGGIKGKRGLGETGASIGTRGNANTAPLGQRRGAFGKLGDEESEKTGTVTTLLGQFRKLNEEREQANRGKMPKTGEFGGMGDSDEEIGKTGGFGGMGNSGGIRGFRGMGENRGGIRRRVGFRGMGANRGGGVVRGRGGFGDTGANMEGWEANTAHFRQREEFEGLCSQGGTGENTGTFRNIGWGSFGESSSSSSRGVDGGMGADRGGQRRSFGERGANRVFFGAMGLGDGGRGSVGRESQRGRGVGLADLNDASEQKAILGKRNFGMQEESSQDDNQEFSNKVMKEQSGGGKGEFGDREMGGIADRGGGGFGEKGNSEIGGEGFGERGSAGIAEKGGGVFVETASTERTGGGGGEGFGERGSAGIAEKGGGLFVETANTERTGGGFGEREFADRGGGGFGERGNAEIGDEGVGERGSAGIAEKGGGGFVERGNTERGGELGSAGIAEKGGGEFGRAGIAEKGGGGFVERGNTERCGGEFGERGGFAERGGGFWERGKGGFAERGGGGFWGGGRGGFTPRGGGGFGERGGFAGRGGAGFGERGFSERGGRGFGGRGFAERGGRGMALHRGIEMWAGASQVSQGFARGFGGGSEFQANRASWRDFQ